MVSQRAVQGRGDALPLSLAGIGAEAATATSEPLSAILDAMSEQEFSAVHVVRGLRDRHWVVWVVPDMQMTTAGLPDVLCWHPMRPGVLLAYELKKTTGRLRVEQRRALEHLATVPGVDARVVRPRDWAQILDVLDNVSGPDLIDVLSAIPRGF